MGGTGAVMDPQDALPKRTKDREKIAVILDWIVELSQN
jgi:hypothetical protein